MDLTRPYKRLRKVWRLIKNRHKFWELENELDRLKARFAGFEKVVPIGNYESPYPSEAELHRGYECFFEEQKHMYGIDLNTTNQLALLEKLKPLVNQCPFPSYKEEKFRFYFKNDWFTGDAYPLFAMLRHFKPHKVLEIGSGFSTSVMLDTNEYFLNNGVEITCIEPRPQRLKALLKDSDNIQILEQDQQNLPLEFFTDFFANSNSDSINNSGGGGWLFIDSSHVSRPFSDVNRQFFQILPNLPKNTIIHLHDIGYPFEYGSVWTINQRRAYNEAYILRAFLEYNDHFEILLWPNYLGNLGKYDARDSGSIYLRKIK